MDTSEQYIKMCEKAEEIQEVWKEGCRTFTAPESAGSFYKPKCPQRAPKWMKDVWDSWMPCMVGAEYHYHELDPDLNSVWLPRQDQLQEMTEFQDIGYMLDAFYAYLIRDVFVRSDFWWKKTSLEQLWLAFVMEQKYNKEWNGGDWVNREDK